MPGTKTPRPERSFVPGPSLADASVLLTWLKANSNAYLRLPVVIFSGGLGGIELAFIGTQAGPPADDAIRLELDDSALGISLSTRLRSLEEAASHAASDGIVVWIEGTWGRLLPEIGSPNDDSVERASWPLTVRDDGPLVEGLPATILVAG